MSVHKNYLTKKSMGESLFKKHSKLQYPIKFFTVTWTKAGTNNRKLLENIFTQKLLQERKLWGKTILENVLGVTVSVKYFNAS